MKMTEAEFKVARREVNRRYRKSKYAKGYVILTKYVHKDAFVECQEAVKRINSAYTEVK